MMKIIQMIQRFLFTTLFFGFLTLANGQEGFRDTSLSNEVRAQKLVGMLTLEEKVSQMMNSTPAIDRLGIPPYDWWNEALHGIGRSGKATVFPQAIALGATFDEELVKDVAIAISGEARAIYNASSSKGFYHKYNGLTFWTPNVNIFRDPRWGRGQETYGEDPFLMSRLGVAFVEGLQGDDPKYLKTAACAKHFAVHSGPEKLRHEFNAISNKQDLHETYLPAFEALVNADVEAIMCAYNRTNGEACCASNTLLQDILIDDWGFDGHILTDCGAIEDFYSENGHHISKDAAEASVLAVKSGVSLNCGSSFTALIEAVENDLISEAEIDEALVQLLITRFELGLFDPKGENPYDELGVEVIDSEKHRALAREAAQKSIVLLKNNGVLPLKNDLGRYFVTGPNAATVEPLLGNYYGINPNMVTVLEGITAAVKPGSQVQYRQGTLLDRDNINPMDWASGTARSSDVTFYVMGISGLLEGEEGASIASPHFGDRLEYDLPQNQIDYLKKLKAKSDRPVVAIVMGGSPMNLAEVHELADAVLLAWYPGEEGGNAIADIVFGKTSPSGKLPVTFPKSLDQLPAYEDYSMKGRTYKYMVEEPLYPFGFGLTYTQFEYTDLMLSKTKIKKDESVSVKVTISNKGNFVSDEVVQLYLTDLEASFSAPFFSLKSIKKVRIEPGDQQELTFMITPDMLKMVNEDGEKVIEKGKYRISVGGSLPSGRSLDLGASKFVQADLNVK